MVIRTIAVLGAGTMGRGIAHTFSRQGYTVRLYDPSATVRETVMEQIRGELEFMAVEGCIPSEQIAHAVDNITVVTSLEEAAGHAQFVLEVCPERLDLKQELFLSLDKICPRDTIFATNSSSLRLGNIIAPLPELRKKKCMVCHWYNPPHLIPVVELSKFGNMSEDDFQAVYELCLSCGKQPVRVLKDIAGMIANRLLHAQAREAFYLFEIGAAEKEDIDRALKYGPCFRNATTGMLETADMGGLDVWLAGEDNLLPELSNATRACNLLRDKVASGHLGIKNGRGFFEYDAHEREQIQKDFFRRLMIQLKASEFY